MCAEVLNHTDPLDGVLKGTTSTVPHDKLFDIVLKLMPTGLSAPARIFGALMVSVLVTDGGAPGGAMGEINRIAGLTGGEE